MLREKMRENSFKENVSRLEEEAKAKEITFLKEGVRLLEKWEKVDGLDGESLRKVEAVNPKKVYRLVHQLENQEKYLAKMGEAVVSSAFNTIPQNIIRVIRLGYPNSIRGDIFHEFTMTGTRDSFYYLNPVFGSTKRGGVTDAVTYESTEHRYPTSIEQDALGTGDGSTVTFGITIAIKPIVPYKTVILVDGVSVAVDDGANAFTSSVLTGTIAYDTGILSVTFTTAPASAAVLVVESLFDTENSDLYTEFGTVNLVTTREDFHAQPKMLKLAWSWMSEVTMDVDLSLNVEETLIQTAAEELKKAIDYEACYIGYRAALASTLVTFNADFRSSGAANPSDFNNTFFRYLKKAETIIYNTF